jgi:hypothetical protein
VQTRALLLLFGRLAVFDRIRGDEEIVVRADTETQVLWSIGRGEHTPIEVARARTRQTRLLTDDDTMHLITGSRVSFPIDRWRRFSTAWDGAETSAGRRSHDAACRFTRAPRD